MHVHRSVLWQTATLAELKLDVIDGDIATDDKGRAVDTLRIRDRGSSLMGLGASPEDRAKSLGERVRGRLQEVLSTTRLRPGELTAGTVALTEASLKERRNSGDRIFKDSSVHSESSFSWSTFRHSSGSRGSRESSGSDDGLGSGTAGNAAGSAAQEGNAIEPLIGLVDMRALGVLLALEATTLGHQWRAYLRCHAPHLLPALIPDDKGLTDDKGIGPFVTAEGSHVLPKLRKTLATLGEQLSSGAAGGLSDDCKPLGSVASQWSDALTGFLLHRLREVAGRGDEGLTLAQLQRGPELGAGACGVVYLARDVLSDRVYAIKTFTLPDDRDRQKTVLRTSAPCPLRPLP